MSDCNSSKDAFICHFLLAKSRPSFGGRQRGLFIPRLVQYDNGQLQDCLIEAPTKPFLLNSRFCFELRYACEELGWAISFAPGPIIWLSCSGIGTIDGLTIKLLEWVSVSVFRHPSLLLFWARYRLVSGCTALLKQKSCSNSWKAPLGTAPSKSIQKPKELC